MLLDQPIKFCITSFKLTLRKNIWDMQYVLTRSVALCSLFDQGTHGDFCLASLAFISLSNRKIQTCSPPPFSNVYVILALQQVLKRWHAG